MRRWFPIPMIVLLVSCAPQDGDPDEGDSGEPEARTATPAVALGAEVLPGPDVWLASVSQNVRGEWMVSGPLNATHREGYDNQPYFLPDGSGFWYTLIDDAGQADIWKHDLATGTNSPVTSTAPESEYSATPLPGGTGFSAIRVEADSTQRLWRFDGDGTNASVLLPDLAPVGYHAWPTPETVVMFVLGRPSTLRSGDVRTGVVETHASNVGRSIHKIPGTSRVSFVQNGDGGSMIKSFDPATGAIEDITAVVGEAQDYVWTPDGTLLMGSGTALYAFAPGSDTEWVKIADFADLGISITRLAVRPDGAQIAMVGERRP